MSFWILWAYLYLFPALIAFGLTALSLCYMVPWLRQKNRLDIPNSRSNHTIPTPRGGGLPLVIITLLIWLFLPYLSPLPIENIIPPNLHFAIAGATLLAVIAWQDDKHHLSPAIRFASHFMATGLLLVSLESDSLLRLAEWGIPITLSKTLLMLAWVWFINLFNFMDGIDGIAATQTICLCMAIFFLSLMLKDLPDYWLLYAAILGASATGFLLFNWHPARCFLGDVGSIPIGYLLGWILLELAICFPHPQYLILALSLPAYYITDSGITIIRRLIKGEAIWQAHSSHAYQLARRAGMDVRHVTLLICAQTFANIPAIFIIFRFIPEHAPILVLATSYGSALLLYGYLSSRRPPE